jgi:NRPS condensation-like uncharacterized protein
MKRIKAELWDKMHYLFRNYNDRMIRAELQYTCELNASVIAEVIMELMNNLPVLHSAFIGNVICPYWSIQSFRIEDVFFVKHCIKRELEEQKNQFLTQCISVHSNVQIKIGLFLCEGTSLLCFVVNHMCMDGMDFKYLIYEFCKYYNCKLINEKYKVGIRNGLRGYDSVYKDFLLNEKNIAKSLYKNINKKDKHKFPFSNKQGTEQSFIVKRKLSAGTVSKLKNVGRIYGATVNDCVLAAYFHSLYTFAEFSKDKQLSVSCAINLRRHMKELQNVGLTNHIAWMQCRIPRCGADMAETLCLTVEGTQCFKQDKYMGLHGLPLLNLAYKIMPYTIAEKVIKIGYSNPYIAMSNIGILDAESLTLNGLVPMDAFMSGAVKYKPFILLTVTTYGEELTLSMCVRGMDQDKEIVQRFLEFMEQNIRNVCDF